MPIHAQAAGIRRAPRSGFRPPACADWCGRDDAAATSAARGLPRVRRARVLRGRGSRRESRRGLAGRGATAAPARGDDAAGGRRGGGWADRDHEPVRGCRHPQQRRPCERARGERLDCLLRDLTSPSLARAGSCRRVSPRARGRPGGSSSSRRASRERASVCQQRATPPDAANRDDGSCASGRGGFGERRASDGESRRSPAAPATRRVRVRALRSAA